eukprot:5893288-Prymnesium_polylepis.1
MQEEGTALAILMSMGVRLGGKYESADEGRKRWVGGGVGAWARGDRRGEGGAGEDSVGKGGAGGRWRQGARRTQKAIITLDSAQC